jgi:hypothetical protein
MMEPLYSFAMINARENGLVFRRDFHMLMKAFLFLFFTNDSSSDYCLSFDVYDSHCPPRTRTFSSK